ncbi:hypothetical protein [Mycobacterium sp. ITM-2016-00318]|uniref:hypothetical protein n=1 Tax=Mycobacterium sp. ITM-2016-00318 TaxID=2099693 RepID=UPI00287F6F0A|nr:hypothetical protein [Mycobacterium sp. ITM-2016-00318]WNG92378.1 hypothetical protein C6A82_023720 [Mycobacterium sp. ITM-2016-00318]
MATGSLLKDRTSPPAQQMVFDFVDGRWLGVSDTNSTTCEVKSTGESKTAQVWFVISLKPHQDGTLSGTAYNIVTDACRTVLQWQITATRRGENPEGVTIADPTSQPPLVSSPAQSFRGRYVAAFKDQPHQPTGTWTPNNHCLRTGERCVTLVDIAPDPSTGKVPYIDEFVYVDGQWTGIKPGGGPQPCGEGTSEKSSGATGSVKFALPPPPVPDPIQSLTLAYSLERVGGDCPGTAERTSILNRIGD